MADMTEVYDALRKADAAGDTESVQKLAQYIQSQPSQPKVEAPQKDPMSWGEAGIQAVGNIPSSLGKMAGGIYEAVSSPVETAKGVLDVAAGGLQNLMPESLVQFVNKIDPNVKSAEEARAKADALGQFYKQRYGSEEGFKQAVATDPAGVMADAASLLTGGGAAIGKIPMMGKVGQAAISAGKAIDPLALTAKGVGAGITAAGKGLQAGLGMTTGAGAEAIKQAYQSGKAGGQQAETFQANLRGNVPVNDVLDIAKSDLAAMNAAKTAEYRANMQGIKADKSVLSLDKIGEEIAKSYGQVTFKGQIKNQTGAEVLKKISDAVGDWKELNPAEFHTPEGLDALKQVVGGIVESIPFEEKTARMVGNNIYNSIKGEISKQAPIYSKTMKNYADASDQIKEIERALSLGHKASADTSMRKLQSLMRNNVSTNYGQRLKLSQELEQQGGGKIIPSLAGQALSSTTPRGLQSATTVPASMMGYSLGGAPLAVAGLATGSPRLMGESAYYTGRAGGAVSGASGRLSDLASRLGVSPEIAANILYQSEQANNPR